MAIQTKPYVTNWKAPAPLNRPVAAKAPGALKPMASEGTQTLNGKAPYVRPNPAGRIPKPAIPAVQRPSGYARKPMGGNDAVGKSPGYNSDISSQFDKLRPGSNNGKDPLVQKERKFKGGLKRNLQPTQGCNTSDLKAVKEGRLSKENLAKAAGLAVKIRAAKAHKGKKTKAQALASAKLGNSSLKDNGWPDYVHPPRKGNHGGKLQPDLFINQVKKAAQAKAAQTGKAVGYHGKEVPASHKVHGAGKPASKR